MYELAQINIGRWAAPLESAQLAAFVEALDPVNALADAAPGFVRRLQTDEGIATSVEAFAWDATADSCGVIVNLSVRTDVDHLAAFVFGPMHRRRSHSGDQALRSTRIWPSDRWTTTVIGWPVAPAGGSIVRL